MFYDVLWYLIYSCSHKGKDHNKFKWYEHSSNQCKWIRYSQKKWRAVFLCVYHNEIRCDHPVFAIINSHRQTNAMQYFERVWRIGLCTLPNLSYSVTVNSSNYSYLATGPLERSLCHWNQRAFGQDFSNKLTPPGTSREPGRMTRCCSWFKHPVLKTRGVAHTVCLALACQTRSTIFNPMLFRKKQPTFLSKKTGSKRQKGPDFPYPSYPSYPSTKNSSAWASWTSARATDSKECLALCANVA